MLYSIASIFHPEVLKLPFLPYCQESAKSSLVNSIESSKDPLVKECVALLFDPEFLSHNQFPTECPTFLQRARDSISHATASSRPPSVKSIISKSLHQKHTDAWNTSLDQLQVESKFKDVVALEPKSRTWNTLLTGLPAGQLSFLLRAGTDCLPTPLYIYEDGGIDQ